MNFKILPVVASLLLVAACETAPTDQGGASGTGAGSGSGAYANVTPGTQSDLVANVGDRVFFDFDSAAISDASKATLDKQAKWLGQYQNVSITVEGHCDERGTREYNLALGERRASAIKKYLASNGVSAGRVTTISYGKERPAVEGSDESAWSQNRRGVTVVNEGQATN